MTGGRAAAARDEQVITAAVRTTATRGHQGDLHPDDSPGASSTTPCTGWAPRQAYRRCGVTIRGSENSVANWDAVPNKAPMRSAYFTTYSGTWSAAGNPGTCSAVPSIRMMSRPMSVTSSPSATLGLWLTLRSLIFAVWL